MCGSCSASTPTQHVQRPLPAALRLGHSLDRAQSSTVRTQRAGIGNQHLLRRVRHKRALVANPEPRWDEAAQVAVVLVLDPLHRGHWCTDAVTLSIR